MSAAPAQGGAAAHRAVLRQKYVALDSRDISTRYCLIHVFSSFVSRRSTENGRDARAYQDYSLKLSGVEETQGLNP